MATLDSVRPSRAPAGGTPLPRWFRSRGRGPKPIDWLGAQLFALAGACAIALIATGCASEPGAVTCATGIICPADSQCAAVQKVCITTDCGNGVQDSGEGCDDGNILDGDGCSSTCRVEDCGNGVQDPGEICDDSNTTAGDGCAADCKSVETCGNGIKDVNEVCDDHNTIAGDGCSADCKSTEICGNGVVDGAVGEVCDDGNTANGDTCASDCRSGVGCGNGSIDLDASGNPLEECDDGNTDSSDDCRADCIVNRCGDGFQNTSGAVDTREACDPATPATTGSKIVDPLETVACNIDCTARSCGDGIINKAAGEQCDNRTLNADTRDCTSTCVLNVCGDGLPDTSGPGNLEQCDDGNLSETDGCTTACTTPACGNGIVDQNEQCDLGSLNADGGACRLDCTISVCGDGSVRVGVEECDDNNTANNDGCSSICRDEVCGNGIRDNLEACDDGNLNDGDGCSSSCGFEHCGDGIINNGEPCDDAGESATCNADCTPASCGDRKVNQQAGEQCDNAGDNSDTGDCKATGAGACKLNVCGDGKQDLQGPIKEACDDGNLVNDDGCNVGCKLPTCPNGITDTGEACDDGNTSDTDACVACAIAFCGDGKVRTGFETCDDGNTVNGDVCDNTCTPPTCGNGIKTSGEACDDGNLVDGDGCSALCALEKCGNGVVDPGEDCDTLTPGGELSGCNRDCTTASCGDGKVNAARGEECDELDSINTDNCISNSAPLALQCKLNVCGDGFKDNANPRQEACDDGNQVNGDGCSNSCTTPSCGNGILDQGEQCDDGNTSDLDACLSSNTDSSTNCRLATCGDGKVRTGVEECDDQNTLNTDDCLNTCELNSCGDGFLDLLGAVPETCDDGNQADETACPYNTISCTGCNATCTAVISNLTGSFCGDGTPDAGFEICDDGNRVTETACPYDTASCSLCSADCKTSLARTGNVCGDGNVDPTFEVCDDHNTLTCGSCSGDCQVAQADHATGVLLPAAGADLNDGDSFTIDDGVNTPATTFVFSAGTVVAPDVKITFSAGDNNTAMRGKIVTAINGVGTSLLVTASNGGGAVILLAHDRATSLGNVDLAEGVASPNFQVSGMTGGQGGDCLASQGCQTADDCGTHNCLANKTCGP